MPARRPDLSTCPRCDGDGIYRSFPGDRPVACALCRGTGRLNELGEAPDAFELAAAMRAGDYDLQPFLLWQLADQDADAYRHAMLHAGGLIAAVTGKPYKTCPTCDAQLEDEAA